MGDISQYDVNYIKLCVHSGTTVEELIAFLQDLEHEKGFLYFSEMFYVKLEKDDEYDLKEKVNGI